MGFNPCSVGRRSETCSLVTNRSNKTCFNPCSVGRRSETDACPGSRPAGKKFQSLFCWKTVGNPGGLHISRQVPGGFQSLFCWKTVGNVPNILLRCHTFIVSILVLLEDGRKPSSVADIDTAVGLFQSLFCWKTVGNSPISCSPS